MDHQPSWEPAGVYQALRTTALVAAAALVGVAPYVYYLTSVAFADRLRDRFSPAGLDQLIRAELASIGLVVVIASLLGTVLARRYGLPGLGEWSQLVRARWLVCGLAPALSIVTYLAFGRAIAERVPGYYPTEVGWALAKALKGALFDEVVARFGMMTILFGAVRRFWLANALQAVFFTGLAVLGLSFYAVQPSLSAYFAASIATSVAVHLLFGWIYARYGLLAVMAFHLAYGLKLVAHALLS